MEKRLEIVCGQERQDAAGDKPLCSPVEDWCGERAEEKGRGEIRQEAGCVFQESNVEFPADAQSTHMERKGRRRPQT